MLCYLEHTTAWEPPSALADHLEAIGFRVLRRRAISEPLLFLDTQAGAVYAHGGRLARSLGGGPTAWRFGAEGEPWLNEGNLADLRRAVPWLPDEVELHPVLYALRSGAVLRLRGLGTRELAVVVERWSFAGTEPPAGLPCATPPAGAASATPWDVANGNGAPLVQHAPCWYVEEDDGPRHDRAYVSMVLEDHAAAFGLPHGRPAGARDPLVTGLRSIGCLPPGLPAPRCLVVRRADSLVTVLGKVIRLQGLRLASCLDGIVGDRHPEYVHDARVATRRARFALRVAAAYGDARARMLSDRLRTVAQVLGPLRDLDLLTGRLGDLAAAVRPETARDPAGCDAAERRLAEALRVRRAELLGPVPELLCGAATASLVQQLSGWSARGIKGRPVEQIAAAAVGKAATKVVRIGDAVRRRADVPVSDLHRLRLRMKRLRYTAELFAGALPRWRDNRALEAVVAVCATGQTTLGDLNDDAVAETELHDARSRLPSTGPGAGAAELATRMIAVLQQRQLRAASGYRKQWRRYRDRLQRALKELPG